MEDTKSPTIDRAVEAGRRESGSRPRPERGHPRWDDVDRIIYANINIFTNECFQRVVVVLTRLVVIYTRTRYNTAAVLQLQKNVTLH